MTGFASQPIGIDADGNTITRCPTDMSNINALIARGLINANEKRALLEYWQGPPPNGQATSHT